MMMIWYPIKTAPKDGTVIDLWLKSGIRGVDKFWSRKRLDWIADDGSYNNISKTNVPTHWSPVYGPNGEDYSDIVKRLYDR